MSEVVAYSTAALTLGLVVVRPQIGAGLRVTPSAAALAGVAFMFALGIVKPDHWTEAAASLWSPFVAIASIMMMTEASRRTGLLDWSAGFIDARATSTARLFLFVFALGIVCSAAFNNDAAILLLTPIIAGLARRRYPERPQMVLPFAFAIFMSAGVAAIPMSNPMNMVVAAFLDIPIGGYIRHMLPIAVTGWIIAFVILRWIFASDLAQPIGPSRATPAPSTGLQRLMMALVGTVFIAYPIVGILGGSVWIVAGSGALLAILLAVRGAGTRTSEMLRTGVSWDTLGFLAAVLLMSLGLRDAGLIDRLAALYQQAGTFTVGSAAAVGSALLNNHPMSYLNMLALRAADASHVHVFAALVGGDLGPRLLPTGSLAGLLWIDALRRHGVEIGVRRFVAVGSLVGIPTVVVSLAMLSLS